MSLFVTENGRGTYAPLFHLSAPRGIYGHSIYMYCDAIDNTYSCSMGQNIFFNNIKKNISHFYIEYLLYSGVGVVFSRDLKG